VAAENLEALGLLVKKPFGVIALLVLALNMGIRDIDNLFFLNRHLLVQRSVSLRLEAPFEVLLHLEDFLKVQRN
jgi:hypothetical protein